MAKWDGIPATLQRWRVDPFTGTPQFLTKTTWETEDLEGVTHTVREAPFNWAVKPYMIMAQEAIYNDGAITLQYDSGGGWTDAVEVDFEPDTAGKYEVDYKFLTGFIRFHSSMDGYSIRLKYTGMGHVVNQEVMYNLLVQQNQYGHEWMAWDTEMHPTKTTGFGAYNWFNWYSFLVNPNHGKGAHWPALKGQFTDGNSITSWTLMMRFLPLWGGCSMSPSIGYVYVGGIMPWNMPFYGPPGKDQDTDCEIEIHDGD